MVLTNKVLTVSYGTFSCTLEGFDDSFGTMKAIAEYFRDLAADDRYFGAEPPQPDVDMLARIAQREVSRRVEARRDGAGIVLRAADEPTDMPASDATIAEPMPETPMPETMSDVVPEQSGANAEIVDDAPETEARAVPETIDMTPVETIPVESESEPVAEATPESTPESTPEPALPPDSIAAKLQRIRAVVSRAADAGEETDFSEDEHADPFLTTTPLDMAQTQPSDGGADMPQDTSLTEETYEEEFEEETAEGDDLSLTLADLGNLDGTAPDEASEGTDSPAAADQGEGFNTLEAGNEALPGESLLDEDAEDEEPETGDVTDEYKDAEGTIFAGLDEPEPEEAAAADVENILKPDAEPDATPSDSPVRARVVKVRRADLETAISSGTLEEISAQPASGSSLSDEAEADLMRELAEVEAELGVGNAVDDAQEAQASEPDQPATGQQRDQVGAVDDVSRLMEEVDHKMGEPESTTRRETYSHLRAAVAATKADRAFTGEVPQLTHDQAFRDDLANVVRPRRPSASSAGDQRPMGNRQAPLKLVAEQRVDDAAADARRGPVRPRRVSPADAETALPGDVPGTPGGFAVFAREAGATGLSELLEAAAAYLSYVEGRDQFSRPQLMTKVRQVEQEDFNREDGLRSFGQLLREGKIRKTKGGRFTASEDIGFKPAQRAAG